MKGSDRVRGAARELASKEIWLVGLVTALSILSPRFQVLGIGAVIGFRIAHWVGFGVISKRTPVDAGVLLLLLAGIVTTWVSPFPGETNLQVGRLILGIGLFYAVVNWVKTKAELQFLSYALIVAGAGLALIAPFSVRWTAGRIPIIPEEIYDNFTLLIADTIHRNVMAGTLVLLLPLPLAYLLFAVKDLSWPTRLFAGFSAALMGSMVILTQSRGGWMAMAAGAAFLLLARGWKSRLTLSLLAAGLWIGLNASGVTNVFEAISADESIGGLAERLDIWASAAAMIRDFPFSGIGMGSFGIVADRLYPFFRSPPDTIPHAHNLYFQVGIDMGIPGLVAWLSVILGVSYSAWQLYTCGRRAEDVRMRALGAGLLASLSAMLVHGLVDAVTWGMVRPAPVVWALWGVAMAGSSLALFGNREPDNLLEVEAETAQ